MPRSPGGSLLNNAFSFSVGGSSAIALPVITGPLNLNVGGEALPTLSSMPALSSTSAFDSIPIYQLPSPGTVKLKKQPTPIKVTLKSPIKNALHQGQSTIGRVPFGRPGLLATVIGAGTAGAVMGDGGFGSFFAGAGAGLIGGTLAEAGAASIDRALRTYQHKNAGKMSASIFKAIGIGRMLTGSSSRGMIFSAGALLAGGMFSSMFASNSTSYKRGFNARRGNSIVR